MKKDRLPAGSQTSLSTYFKELRKLSLLVTSFGFELVKQQISFAKELTDLFVKAPAGGSDAIALIALDEPLAPKAGDRAAREAVLNALDEPAGESLELRLRAEPLARPGRSARVNESRIGSTNMSNLKSIEGGPTADERFNNRAAFPDDDKFAWSARHDPLAVSSAEAAASFHDRVEKRAYELWENDGHPQGRNLRHWLQAEHEMRPGFERAMAGQGVLHPAA